MVYTAWGDWDPRCWHSLLVVRVGNGERKFITDPLLAKLLFSQSQRKSFIRKLDSETWPCLWSERLGWGSGIYTASWSYQSVTPEPPGRIVISSDSEAYSFPAGKTHRADKGHQAPRRTDLQSTPIRIFSASWAQFPHQEKVSPTNQQRWNMALA